MPTSALAEACFFLWADVGICPYANCVGGNTIKKLMNNWEELRFICKLRQGCVLA